MAFVPGSDFAKNFELVTMDLTTATGNKIGLRFMMLEFNVYEDIWNNNVTCDIVINDAINMIMNQPLFGFETLKLEFRTPSKNLWSKTLRLVRITNRSLVKDREIVYLLHFKTRVSKSYKGKLISDIVNDLHTNWLKSKTAINVETTKLQQHIIIPNLQPCHAINWMAAHANSASYAGANYVYYEDKTQFNFVTIESRLALATSQTYLFQVANIRLDSSSDYKPQDVTTNILAVEGYTFDNHSDILENMGAGMYGNTLLTHSNARKIWKRYTFDYPGSFDTYKHLYPGKPLYSSAVADLADPSSKLKLHSTGQDEDNYPTYPELWVPCRISQLQQLNNIRLTLTVPGDSERTVGEVVEFALPSPEPPQKDKQINDKYYSGRYLVQSLRHKINQDEYVTVLELVKDSTPVAFP
jgi:hypothetical protein